MEFSLLRRALPVSEEEITGEANAYSRSKSINLRILLKTISKTFKIVRLNSHMVFHVAHAVVLI